MAFCICLYIIRCSSEKRSLKTWFLIESRLPCGSAAFWRSTLAVAGRLFGVMPVAAKGAASLCKSRYLYMLSPNLFLKLLSISCLPVSRQLQIVLYRDVVREFTNIFCLRSKQLSCGPKTVFKTHKRQLLILWDWVLSAPTKKRSTLRKGRHNP